MNKIRKIDTRYHTKASEKYIDVDFLYPGGAQHSTSVPIVYRRTGTDIPDEEIDQYLLMVYKDIDPINRSVWIKDQKKFWDEKPGAAVTRGFFEVLSKNFEWCCATCTLPSNPNFARRIQDIKEFGYTLSTNTRRACKRCNKNTTQIILVPLKRGGITGYETWSPAIRNSIVETLNSFDAFEAKLARKEGLLPDHKFPEIRWDAETKRESLSNLTTADIKRDFQLLTNQRNQQKREICRDCFQTGRRGNIYGIRFFYKGNDSWKASIPKVGKLAEAGCVGCGWYDIEAWREALTKRLGS